MRYSEFRHETKKAHSSLFVLSFLGVFLCAAALGTIRLYGLYLEHRISETTAKIETCRDQNMSLSRRYQELLAPARIYSYARESLGMVNADHVTTIKVDEKAVMTAKASVQPVTVADAGLLEDFNPFVNKAHAKN